MTTDLLAGLLSAVLMLPSRPAPDPCALVSPAEIASALGAKPGPGKKEGPTRDEESKADTSSCMFTVGDGVLVVGVSELGNNQGAAAALDEAERVAKDADVGIPLTPQSGVGDGALYGFTEEGASWAAQKGRFVLTVTVGGVGDPSKLREPLKRLVLSALSKL